MKLIVGLGNPGRKYRDTRHNIGFEVVDCLAERFGPSRVRRRFHADTIEGVVGGQPVMLLCPQTYMNRSGRSVSAARDFFKIEPSDILVVCDDFHLPLGRMRCRRQGSAGGQKGLLDILRFLGTEHIPRLRIGIGEPPENWDVADYVLSRFSRAERETVDVAIARAADAAADWLEQGIEYCMNRYNAAET